MSYFTRRNICFGILFSLLVINVKVSADEEEGFCSSEKCEEGSERVKTHLIQEGTLHLKIWIAFSMKASLCITVDQEDEWKYFKEKISNALSNYETAPFQNCSHFTNLVTEDLKVFRDGITKDSLVRAKERY